MRCPCTHIFSIPATGRSGSSKRSLPECCCSQLRRARTHPILWRLLSGPHWPVEDTRERLLPRYQSRDRIRHTCPPRGRCSPTTSTSLVHACPVCRPDPLSSRTYLRNWLLDERVIWRGHGGPCRSVCVRAGFKTVVTPGPVLRRCPLDQTLFRWLYVLWSLITVSSCVAPTND